MARLNIVLHEPEIPANTGNIGRTCVATGTRLHLIEPLGFSLSEKAIKRAGMDYWKDLDVTTYLDYEEFLQKNPGAKIYYATTKGLQTYTDVKFEDDCYIMFGKESAGIPEEILMKHKENCIRIPMINDIRSLNLSNSVAIVLYEALRQNNLTTCSSRENCMIINGNKFPAKSNKAALLTEKEGSAWNWKDIVSTRKLRVEFANRFSFSKMQMCSWLTPVSSVREMWQSRMAS